MKKKASSEEMPEVAAEDVVEAPPPPPAPKAQVAAPVTHKKYRVKKGGQVMISGCITFLPEGEIVEEAGYGPVGIARLLEQKIELELIK